MQKNYGFKPSAIQLEHYKLGDGNLAPAIIMPQGHGWKDYLPADDLQSNSELETDNCTNYGTLHALVTLGKQKFSVQFQTALSERYTGIMTGTGPGGNDPWTVIDTIARYCGVVPAVYLPFGPGVQTWQEYYSPNPMTYALYAMGAHWLKKYKVSYQWVTLPGDSQQIMQQKMREALQFSPLGASVFAWSLHSDGRYYSDEPGQNHWVTVYDYLADGSWCVFDSYDNTHKVLDPNFIFGQVIGYGLDFNVGGATLGEVPEQVYLPYTGYLVKNFINEILK